MECNASNIYEARRRILAVDTETTTFNHRSDQHIIDDSDRHLSSPLLPGEK